MILLGMIVPPVVSGNAENINCNLLDFLPSGIQTARGLWHGASVLFFCPSFVGVFVTHLVPDSGICLGYQQYECDYYGLAADLVLLNLHCCFGIRHVYPSESPYPLVTGI